MRSFEKITAQAASGKSLWTGCYECRKLRSSPDPGRREAVSLCLGVLTGSGRRVPPAGEYTFKSLARDLLVSCPPLDEAELCAAIEVVREWRNWLERRGITQPFAQARRDVFLPNEEEVLGAASTRFAGHTLQDAGRGAVCDEGRRRTAACAAIRQLTRQR